VQRIFEISKKEIYRENMDPAKIGNAFLRTYYGRLDSARRGEMHALYVRFFFSNFERSSPCYYVSSRATFFENLTVFYFYF